MNTGFKLSKVKAFEFQVDRFPFWIGKWFDVRLTVGDEYFPFLLNLTIFGNVFNVRIEWNRKTDHAGFRITIEILSLFIAFVIYDVRHWDHEKEIWKS